MPADRAWLPSGAAGIVLGALLVPSDGQTSDLTYSCRYGSLEREVEVAVDDPERGAPCAVLYRKLQEEPGREQALWTAQNDGDFCREKSLDLVKRLEDGGWLCDQLDPPEPETTEAAVPAPTQPAAPVPVERPLEDEPELAAAVARDLAFLKDSADGEVEAEIGDVGDLNGDGTSDAAVLITFDNDGANHKQYLVAYIADGPTFRATASTFIGGRYRDVYGALVKDIQDGIISLEIQVLEDGDPYCCPSGTEQVAFRLNEDELVRLP